jgi:hypothetical protein
MGREPWKCPHANCKQESARFWNLMRHIKRLHKGEGIPVKNKSDIEKTAQDTRHRGDLEGPYPRNSLAMEDYKIIQRVKITSEIDPVDKFYQMYRKYRERNDKVEEMRDYFANKKSNIPFPPNFAHEIFNHNKPESTLPFHIWSGFSFESLPSISVPSAPLPSTPSTPHVDKVQPKVVVGYVEYICNNCLEFEPLKVMYEPGASDMISWTHHACDPDTLKSAMSYPAFFREDVYFFRILCSSEEMTKAVKEWTNGSVFLISNKLTSNDVPKCTITLELRKNEYEWLTRAIAQKYTILDDKELKEYFNLTSEYCATFCYLCINFARVKGEQNAKQDFYYLFLSYKPCLPWEDR